MARTEANGVEIEFAEAGSGDPVVLVHGSWSDRTTWDQLPSRLAQLGRVITYDRSGHGQSPGRAHDSTRRDHEDDLAALIERLVDERATVIGTSFGGSIALGMAARRPDLVGRVIVHEPPLAAWAPDEPETLKQLGLVAEACASVIALIDSGDPTGAARVFAEEVALGPGAWAALPESARLTMIATAPTFAMEQRDPAWGMLPGAAEIECPVLMTLGTLSPAWFRGITEALAAAIPDAQVRTVAGAGHAPHATHPTEYSQLLEPFLTRKGTVGVA